MLNCKFFFFNQVELCCEVAHNPIWPAQEMCGPFLMSLMKIRALCYAPLCVGLNLNCVRIYTHLRVYVSGLRFLFCLSHVYITSVEKFYSLLGGGVREIN